MIFQDTALADRALAETHPLIQKGVQALEILVAWLQPDGSDNSVRLVEQPSPVHIGIRCRGRKLTAGLQFPCKTAQ